MTQRLRKGGKMAYQKTAKDLAWDRERQKLQSEIQNLRQECRRRDSIISAQEQEMLAMSIENDELRAAIVELTQSGTTPEEVLAKMRKQAELADTMKFFVNGARGLF